jgi:hypothetical protein
VLVLEGCKWGFYSGVQGSSYAGAMRYLESVRQCRMTQTELVSSRVKEYLKFWMNKDVSARCNQQIFKFFTDICRVLARLVTLNLCPEAVSLEPQFEALLLFPCSNHFSLTATCTPAVL